MKSRPLTFFLLAQTSVAFLPGLNLKGYKNSNLVPVRIGSLSSFKERVPFDYWELPVCRAEGESAPNEHLREIFASSYAGSPYILRMLNPVNCAFVCETVPVADQKESLKYLIDSDYRINWDVGSFPALYSSGGSNYLESGFPVGFKDVSENEENPKYYLYNFLDISVFYEEFTEEPEEDQPQEPLEKYFRIVGVEVIPNSKVPLADIDPRDFNCFSDYGPLDVDADAFPFYYTVKWEPSTSKDYSLWLSHNFETLAGQGDLRWNSIIHSLAILVLLSGLLGAILLRALRKDIDLYNNQRVEEDPEDLGWKLLHGDVFRKPNHSTILVSLTGSGVQVMGMIIATSFLLLLSLFVPSINPHITKISLMLWSLLGFPAGYTSARFYKLFGSENWKLTVIRTAFLYPGVCFSVFATLNVVLQSIGSSAAVGFLGMLALFLLWTVVSTAGVLAGCFVAYKLPVLSLPVRVNKIPRQIPQQPWYMDTVIFCSLSGLLPFAAVFTELHFGFFSQWHSNEHIFIGFIMAVVLITAITCAEVSITVVYFTFLKDDYKWWWKSFFASGTSGVYVALYSLYHFVAQMESNRVTSAIVYACYSFLLSFTFFILTGTAGFLSSFYFVKTIFSTIKIE
eukprot:GHVP01035276.1.p1 GENE.GHVP01035276.1~~GHVP01035276.1.p1  ORF type:complete len:625 (-),score=86.02 GHVP01035276.1:850-2724(-)